MNENPFPGPLVSILLLPWSSKVLPKMEAPSLPNGNRDELKGAGGKWRPP